MLGEPTPNKWGRLGEEGLTYEYLELTFTTHHKLLVTLKQNIVKNKYLL